MRFLSLSVRNLGVFRDVPPLMLTPPAERTERHHLTIFGGHNGTGKTTLFRAVPLALHGAFALGNRVSQKAYTDRLKELFHRSRRPGDASLSAPAKIAVELEHVQFGKKNVVEVVRSWQRNGNSILETLNIRQDGRDIDAPDPQAWLDGLVPPALLPIYFFDAEELAAATNAEEQRELLHDTLRRLLGLHHVERLQTDLKQYALKRGGGRDTTRLLDELLQQQSLVETLEQELKEVSAISKQLTQSQSEIQRELERQERRLRAEGGLYAERRPQLQEESVRTQAEIDALSAQLQQLCAELLPFALVPPLTAQLREQLGHEDRLRRQRVAQEVWQVKAAELLERFEKAMEGLNEAGRATDTLERLLNQTHPLAPSADADTSDIDTLRHDLSSSEHRRIEDWIAQTRHGLAAQVQSLGKALRERRARKGEIEADLRRAPDDEALTAIHQEIAALQGKREKLFRQQLEIRRQLGALEASYNEQYRRHERARKAFEEARSGEQATDLATRSQSVLKAYRDALIRQRLTQLEELLTGSFNRICRKEHLLTGVSVDPATFQTELRGQNGRVVHLEDFSAGERQLYILALLQAMRQLSGLNLPLFVDTPFARLDETHRQRLLTHYFPNVSDQVVLFATDAELGTLLSPRPDPHLARLYELEHDATAGQTHVTYRDYTALRSQVEEAEAAYRA